MTAIEHYTAIHQLRSCRRAASQRPPRLSRSASCALLAIAVANATGWAQVEPARAPSDISARPEIVGCHIGFDGFYKLGFWTPVWIAVRGMADLDNCQLELVCPDNDGVPTTVRVAASHSTVRENGDLHDVLTYTKIGKADAVVTVRILVDDAIVARRNFSVAAQLEVVGISEPLPAISEFFLQIGSSDIGLSEALPVRNSEGGHIPRQMARVADVTKLPDEWYGYDMVDCLILLVGAANSLESMTSADAPMVAIRRWVEMGGRLVLFCGADGTELMRPPGAVSDLIPGKLDNIVTLGETGALELYGETALAVPDTGQRLEIRVPRLIDVRGRIESYEGSLPTDLPLVVRAPLGFGEVVFAAVDLSQEPFQAWPDRHQLVKKLIRAPDLPSGSSVSRSQALSTRGYSDLAAALRQRLGRQFLGVTMLPFGFVAAAVVAYLALIGPLDYYLVKKLMGRMEWTWVTFPAIILLACGGAYWYTGSSKGSQLRTNFAEVVDLDIVNGQARGIVWASVYSPRDARYNLSVQPRWPNGNAVSSPRTILSWMGRPGSGLGGMQADSGLASFGTEYRIHTHSGNLDGLPIPVWSTKTVTGRWSAQATNWVTAELTATGDGLIEGLLRNVSGTELVNARLLFGRWAWRLGDLGDGQVVTIDDRRDPVKVTTLLTSRVRTALPAQTTSGLREVFVPEQASLDQLLDLLSFYDAVGGYRFTQLSNRLQPHCDLSHLLEHDLAILMAHNNSPRSELLHDHQSVRTANDQSWTLYRFVLPVASEP